MSIIFNRNITLFWNKHATTGAALLVHNRSSPFISDCIFLHHILKMKPNKVYQVLGGCLIEVTTMEELSLGRQKGGCWIEVWFPILFFNYFRTFITGRLINCGALWVVASHTGVFRGARLSSLPTNACSTEDNIPFPSLANHFVLSKFWKVDHVPQGNLIITRSAWNTGKAFRPLINVRFRAAKKC